MENEMTLEFDAVSENESFARVAVAAFIAPLDPTLEEISDVKTAVSEAVTNAVIHGYAGWQVSRPVEQSTDMGLEREEYGNALGASDRPGKITLRCRITGDVLHIQVEDQGCGIPDVEQAMEPLFTTLPDQNRSGMGFSFMEAFMDDLEVESEPGKGTVVRMIKKLGTSPWIWIDEEEEPEETWKKYQY